MKTAIENYLNIIHPNGLRKTQIENFFKAENISITDIGNYLLMEFRDISTNDIIEYLCVIKTDYNIYKGFFNKQNAIDYCLDKINTEGKQFEL